MMQNWKTVDEKLYVKYLFIMKTCIVKQKLRFLKFTEFPLLFIMFQFININSWIKFGTTHNGDFWWRIEPILNGTSHKSGTEGDLRKTPAQTAGWGGGITEHEKEDETTGTAKSKSTEGSPDTGGECCWKQSATTTTASWPNSTQGMSYPDTTGHKLLPVRRMETTYVSTVGVSHVLTGLHVRLGILIAKILQQKRSLCESMS